MVAVLLSVLIAGCVSVAVASLFWRVRSQRSLSAIALLSKTFFACLLSASALVLSTAMCASTVAGHIQFEDEATLRFVLELTGVLTSGFQFAALPLGLVFFLSTFPFASDIRDMVQDGWRRTEAVSGEGSS